MFKQENLYRAEKFVSESK